MKYDDIVIGSGISGLTCAAVLARNGRKVLIVESSSRLGGSLKQFKRQNISFDVGFHYTGCLGPNDILNRLWSYCGVLPEMKVLPFPESGHDRLYIDSFSTPIRCFFSYERFTTELKQLFPNQHGAIDHYFNEIQQICSQVPFYNFSVPLTNYLRGYKKRSRSLKKFITSLTDDQYLQAVFCAPSFLYGVNTEQASLETHALVAHGYYSGAYSIGGGGQAIVNSFKEQLNRLGTEFRTKHHIQSIETDGYKVSGVTTQLQKFIPCDNVIFTGHPSLLFNMVSPAFFRPAYRKRLLSLRNSISMFALFGTISQEKTQKNLDWVNHLLVPQGVNVIPSSRQSSLKHEALFLTSTEIELQNIPLRRDRKSVILLKPAQWNDMKNYITSSHADRPNGYEDLKEKIADSMTQQAESCWGDFCGPIETLAFGTPLTFRDELLAPEGCTYGAMHSIDQFTPDIRTRLPGLWLAGQSTLMTGIVGSSLSGMVCAGEIVGLESLWEKVKQCS